MRAGPLDRRVVLQRPTDVQDAAGGITQTWAYIGTVWAQRQDVRAREFVAANVTLAEVDAVFRIRHRADVAPRWRILAEDRVFEITGITQLGRLDGLELRCTAVQEG